MLVIKKMLIFVPVVGWLENISVIEIMEKNTLCLDQTLFEHREK